MSKIIAVWGCPGSGKTTFCAKLAMLINKVYPTKVICILADPVMPALPVLFPNKKAGDMRSVGAVLSWTEITQDTVLKNLVTAEQQREVGFLGYIDGENRYSYPDFSSDKPAALFDAASALADYVVVDCGAALSEPLSFAALSKADKIFRLHKPDLKAISFYSSHSPLYSDTKFRPDEHIPVLNVPEQEAYITLEDAARQFGCAVTIPYAREVKRQSMDGQIMNGVSNKPFNKAMIEVIKAVV
jgi:MinD-like ATPase involved in chromosome partitioning or flagellar assembly